MNQNITITTTITTTIATTPEDDDYSFDVFDLAAYLGLYDEDSPNV